MPAEPAARHRSAPAADPPSAAVRRQAWLPDAGFEASVRQPAQSVPGARAASWRSRLRWDPGRRGAAALGVLLIVAVAATGWWLAAARPHEVPVSAAGGVTPASPSVSAAMTNSAPAAAPPTSPAAAPSASAALLVVDVAGKVHRPGIYTLPPTARVYDAVQAAGGARSGVSTMSLNLAEPLHDGEQIVVGRPAAPGSGTTPPPGAPAPSASPVVVDLNTATLDELETLPGVGPVLGQHILDWRSANGQFTSIDQLQQVSGIGDVRFAQLSPLVTV